MTPRAVVLVEGAGDAGAAAWCRGVAGPAVPVRVCDADLEDELLRALGTDRVHAVLDAHGELAALHALARRPGRRGCTDAENLRRFLSARSGRTIRYAALFAAALEPGELPDPLRRVLADVGL